MHRNYSSVVRVWSARFVRLLPLALAACGLSIDDLGQYAPAPQPEPARDGRVATGAGFPVDGSIGAGGTGSHVSPDSGTYIATDSGTDTGNTVLPCDQDRDGDGTGDCQDECPDDPRKIAHGECGCGKTEDDRDLDGTPDCTDNCPDDGAKVEPGHYGCGKTEDDRDLDGTPDCTDNCPDDGAKVEPGHCGCGNTENDRDLDGTPDCIDNCPDDGAKVKPGLCGCGTTDNDRDLDGTPDCIDNCPDDGAKVELGECGCGKSEAVCAGSIICDQECVKRVARVGWSSDDAEEVVEPRYKCGLFGNSACYAKGGMYLNSTDLEMTEDIDYHADRQLVGMRFANVDVPPNANIMDAYVEFVAQIGDSGETSLEISFQASDNAATFSTEPWNLSTRPKVYPVVQWTVDEWKADTAYRTPNLSAALRAVVGRQGWASGNSVVVMVAGTGRRSAMSYDGSSKDAALLHVTYAQ